MRFVSFFAGIGGIDLGLERAGHTCVGQVEIDEFCLKVLAKHWPDTWRYGDIRELKAEEIPQADLWAAGFPCQDISNAGKRAGIKGQRSGLYFDFMRLAAEVRPRYILLENVAALINRGLDTILGTLAESGYDAEWDCIPAAAVGAPHIRNRIFIVGRNANGRRGNQECRIQEGQNSIPRGIRTGMANADIIKSKVGRINQTDAAAGGTGGSVEGGSRGNDTGFLDPSQNGPLADPPSKRSNTRRAERQGFGRSAALIEFSSTVGAEQWSVEPNVGRVAHGIPSRVDRLRGLGNAVVPQVAEYIGRLLKEQER